jgi:signal transduction histidine kinase
MALLLVRATLLARLAVPASPRDRTTTGVIPSPRSTEPSTRKAPVLEKSEPSPPASLASPSRVNARAAGLRQQTLLALAATAFVLSVTLVFGLSIRFTRTDERPPLAAARSEIRTLARLAESSLAQGVELNRERDVRRRAEEDAQFKQQLLTLSLEEKIRLGRDLHDGIIQSLYAVGLTLESVRALVRQDPAEADRRLEQTRANINNSIRDVRAYITGLVPENLQRTGFTHALETLVLELQAGRDVRFDVKIDDDAAALLSVEQGQQALQIVREAVSNALRHGGASMVTLRVHKSDREVCVLIQDNGVGFDASKRRIGGHGLGNMKARAERLGATLIVTSQPGQGARVIATLPILQPAAI